MKVLTNEQMRAADRYTIDEMGVSALELMERAGEALCRTAKEMAPKGKILIVCGGGNNGGDGFVCARRLLADARSADVVYLGEKASTECQINRAEFEMNGGKILDAFPEEKKYALVIDCLFGTGYRRREKNERETFDVINEFKASGAKILSADLPSGLADNGDGQGGVIADQTLCLGEIKTAAVLGDGLDHCGELLRADIGICLPGQEDEYALLADAELVKTLLPKRKRNTHKGSYGRAAIVGGSVRCTGAAQLAFSACLKGGAGYTSLYLPENIFPAFLLKNPEGLLVPCREKFDEKDYLPLLGETAIGVGVGMTTEGRTLPLLRFLLKNYTGKLLIDADGLNALALMEEEECEGLFRQKKCEVLLTPHVKEFARLLKADVADVTESAIERAKEYAKRQGVTVLLKGASTVVTDGERVRICACGNAGLAKGGSGDTLTGLITSLLATGLSPLDGGVAGAYVAGLAAELACENCAENALTATDVIAHLGMTFLRVQR